MTLDELKKFCADADDIRHGLQQPWTRDGYTWASNGHIIIRVSTMPDVEDNSAAPNAASLWSRTSLPKRWYPVPDCKPPKDIACDWCNGDGRESNDKRTKCEDCGGTKTMPDYRSSLVVSNIHFAQRYLAMIQGWKIAPNENQAAWIRKDDAHGLLMPIRK